MILQPTGQFRVFTESIETSSLCGNCDLPIVPSILTWLQLKELILLHLNASSSLSQPVNSWNVHDIDYAQLVHLGRVSCLRLRCVTYVIAVGLIGFLAAWYKMPLNQACIVTWLLLVLDLVFQYQPNNWLGRLAFCPQSSDWLGRSSPK